MSAQRKPSARLASALLAGSLAFAVVGCSDDDSDEIEQEVDEVEQEVDEEVDEIEEELDEVEDELQE